MMQYKRQYKRGQATFSVSIDGLVSEKVACPLLWSQEAWSVMSGIWVQAVASSGLHPTRVVFGGGW